MVIAFIWSNGVVVEDCRNSHFSRSYTEEYCNRFFSVADRALFFTRIEKSDRTEGLTNMDEMPIEFYECINPMSVYGFLRRKVNDERLENVISKSDAVVINLPSLFVGKRAETICRKKGVPYLVQLGGCPWDVLKNRGIIGKLLAFPALIANKRDIKKAPAVIYVTKNFLQNRYPTHGKSIGCSNVTLQEVSDQVLVQRIKKIDSHKGKLIIGTAAAIDIRYKGQQYVIKALEKLKKLGDDRYEYQIVGGGDPRYLNGVIRKLHLGANVKILGSLKHEDVFKWMDEIDLYIQPSRTEGLPRAMIEAMSRGVPCLGANSGGIPELIENKCIFSNGINEVKEIAELLHQIDKDSMREMANRNFKSAKQYNAKTLRMRRNSFYREILRDEKREGEEEK